MKINEKSNLNLDKENKRNNQLKIEYPSTTMNYKTNFTANEAKIHLHYQHLKCLKDFLIKNLI